MRTINPTSEPAMTGVEEGRRSGLGCVDGVDESVDDAGLDRDVACCDVDDALARK